MNALYFYIWIALHPYLALWWKSFENAGRQSWEALVPGYNYFIAFKVFCKKPWWSLLLVFPGVHLVMVASLNVSYIRRFGYFSFLDTLQGIVFPYLIFAKIANSGDKMLPETNWANTGEMEKRKWGDHLALFLALPVLGHAIALGIDAVTRHKPGKKSKVKEWGDSLIFALVAASVIRTYVFEPFQIPTGSMEKTLLVGDFLFVNKLAYGPKVPVTPLSYPLVHNTAPWVNIKSYTQLETLKYTRLPGFTDIHRNDVVVFNYPSGDTAIYDPRIPDGLMGHDYHDYVLHEARVLYEYSKEHGANYRLAHDFYTDSISKVNADREDAMKLPLTMVDSLTNNFIYQKFIENLDYWKNEGRKYLASGKAHDKFTGQIIEHYGLIYRPVDKRENYIKRCVGVPGDWLEIKSSILYVNDKPAFVAENQNLMYIVSYPGELSDKFMEEIGMDFKRGDYARVEVQENMSIYRMHATLTQKKKIMNRFPEAKFELYLEPQYSDEEGRKPSYTELAENLKRFPKDPYVNNTVTDFTKFQIPKKGQSIKINKDNIAWYRRIIHAYEGHALEEKKDGIYIDGKKADSYTFAMNYYWMMGDNRYNSADSRMWGFVPEDHIVGKASMVWFSKNPFGGVRWERLFNVIE